MTLRLLLLAAVLLVAPAWATNDLAGNPLVVDTASSTISIWAGDPVLISRVRWVGATTAGHQLIVKDGAGHVKAAFVATAANFTDDLEWHMPLEFKGGVFVSTLGSGIAYIYLAPYR